MKIILLSLLCIIVTIFANRAESDDTCSNFQVIPIENSFPALVTGLNLETVTNVDFNHVNTYLLRHKVLIFKNQSELTVEGQRRFTQLFGPLQVHLESTSHHPVYNDVNVISNLKKDSGEPIGLYGDHVENFHTDLSWSNIPNKVTLLKSEILPEIGGDTDFVDTVSAYQDLPEEFKERILGLQGHFSYLKFRDTVPGIVGDDWEFIKRGTNHSLISIHPETGERNIFCNRAHTIRVVSLASEESDEILSVLFDQVDDLKYRYVHKWENGDVVLWDNRALQHRATASPNTPRMLVRTTVVDVNFKENMD